MVEDAAADQGVIAVREVEMLENLLEPSDARYDHVHGFAHRTNADDVAGEDDRSGSSVAMYEQTMLWVQLLAENRAARAQHGDGEEHENDQILTYHGGAPEVCALSL